MYNGLSMSIRDYIATGDPEPKDDIDSFPDGLRTCELPVDRIRG